MKRLIPLLLIAILVVWLIVLYLGKDRFTPPSDYDYPANDSIDVAYHDPVLVQQYYENVYKIGAFARGVWLHQEIDVRFPEVGHMESEKAAKAYSQMWATTKQIEQQLIASADYKSNGFSNAEIRRIEHEGVTPTTIKLERQIGTLMLKKGDESPGVLFLQQKLTAKGYEMPVDGRFGAETEAGVMAFQQASGLIPSGVAGPETLKLIIQ